MISVLLRKNSLGQEEPNWGGVEPLGTGVAVSDKNEGHARGREISGECLLTQLLFSATEFPPWGLFSLAFVGFLFDFF